MGHGGGGEGGHAAVWQKVGPTGFSPTSELPSNSGCFPGIWKEGGSVFGELSG